MLRWGHQRAEINAQATSKTASRRPSDSACAPVERRRKMRLHRPEEAPASFVKMSSQANVGALATSLALKKGRLLRAVLPQRLRGRQPSSSQDTVCSPPLLPTGLILTDEQFVR